jgi:hypothetical protein
MGLRPTQGDEQRLPSSTTLAGSTVLPFVISTGAQRSGEICGLPIAGPAAGHNRPLLCHLDRSVEICGSAVLSWKCFRRDGRSSE